MDRKYKYFSFFGLFLVLYSLCFVIAERLIKFSITEFQGLGFEVITINPLESINLVLETSIYITISILIPFIIILGYEWLKDALYDKERAIIKGFFKWSFISIIGGVVGLGITYYVILPFLLDYNTKLGLPNTVSLQQIILLFISNFMIMALMFLVPVIFKILNKLNIIYKETLKKGRKVFYMVSVILIAVVTPTTDAISLIVMSIPIIFIYEISIIMITKKQETKGLIIE